MDEHPIDEFHRPTSIMTCLAAPLPFACLAWAMVEDVARSALASGAAFVTAYVAVLTLLVVMIERFKAYPARPGPVTDRYFAPALAGWLGLALTTATVAALVDGAAWLAAPIAMGWPIAAF